MLEIARALLADLDETWMKDALCREYASFGLTPDAWFPEHGQRTEPARAVCDRCAVVAECLGYALEQVALPGVWGSTNEKQRMRIQRGQSSL